MRKYLLIPAILLLSSCGKPESPPAQAATNPAPASAAPASKSAATDAAAPAAAAPGGAEADAVAAPTWTAPAKAAPESVPTGDTATAAVPVPEPAPEDAPVAETAPAPAPAETTAPARQTAPAPPIAPDAPYKVVDGRIDADTVEGWKIYRGIGTCATCHGPVGQGGVGPALIESLKERITKELFVEVVANGRDGTMMKPFGENRIVMDNIDRIYAYLKARADGVLGPENLIKYPLGKIQ